MEKNYSMTKLIYKHKVVFALGIVIVFTITYGILFIAGFVPDELAPTRDSFNTLGRAPEEYMKSDTQSPPLSLEEEPVRIVIENIGVDTTVSNPTSRAINLLDDLLKKGAVRYPGSGLSGSGNMFIFGHSTGLRVVNNQAYRAFNRLGELEAGDEIRVEGKEYSYLYKVDRVRLALETEELVNFANGKTMLTLSTCNTFGKKQERFVVEASFVGKFSR